MNQDSYVAPQFGISAFNCPLCNAFAHQAWNDLYSMSGRIGFSQLDGWNSSTCSRCSAISIWRENTLVFPQKLTAPLPSLEMPAVVLADYEEAREIADKSPKGAAALLRLSIQKLCKVLGEPGHNINEDIKNLVKKGLPERVQKALDTVRVTGNEAVHPGTIDLDDNPQMVLSLFKLVNLIVEKMITEPKEVDALYASLPTEKLEQIKKRDTK